MPTPQKRRIKEKRNEQKANKDGKKRVTMRIACIYITVYLFVTI